MSLIQAILMGIMQGLTEFLPVSSSGHLVLTSSLYKYFTGKGMASGGSQEVFFDIVLHLGTLIAVLIYFKDDIIKILKEFVFACRNKNFDSYEAKLPLYIVLSTFCTLILILPLKDIVETLVVAPFWSGVFLIVTAIVLYSSEFVAKSKTAQVSEVNVKQSILIGLAQGLAIFPGLSRSGMTIAMGLFSGLDRVSAAKYSFLLSIPIIAAASMFYPLFEFNIADLKTFHWLPMFVGFLVSALVGYFCIKYFIRFLSKFTMKGFAYYCFLVGLFVIIGFRALGIGG